MKILNIKFFNNNNYAKTNKDYAQTKVYTNNPDLKQSPLKFLGRSKVAHDNYILNRDDKQFIDVVSRDLRFSEGQKNKFTNVVKDYLKENNLKSMDETYNDDCTEQVKFMNKVSEEMDLSDAEFDVLNFHLIDRMYCEGIYIPEDRRFVKDLSIIEPILEKHGLDEETTDAVTATMMIDADNFKCNTLFDIFNNHVDKYEDTLFYNTLLDTVGDNESIDILIDLCLKSKLYINLGENIFPKSNDSAKFYNSLDDEFITDEIIETFGIEEAEGEKIFQQIVKRHGDTSLQQIGFEIADTYKLPPKADKKVIEIIQNHKNLNEIMKQFDDE